MMTSYVKKLDRSTMIGGPFHLRSSASVSDSELSTLVARHAMARWARTLCLDYRQSFSRPCQIVVGHSQGLEAGNGVFDVTTGRLMLAALLPQKASAQKQTGLPRATPMFPNEG